MTAARILVSHHFWPELAWSWPTFEPVLVRRIDPNIKIILTPHEDLQHDGYGDMHAPYAAWRRGIIDDYAGCMQYRRLFAFPTLPSPATFRDCEAQLSSIDRDQEAALLAWIEQFDIVVPTAENFNVERQFKACHIPAHWDILREEWGTAFPPSLLKLHPHNMFVMRAAEFDAYMTFWSALMKRLEPRIIPPLDHYQSRAYAFLSERIFTLWLFQRREQFPHLKIAEIPVITGVKIPL